MTRSRFELCLAVPDMHVELMPGLHPDDELRPCSHRIVRAGHYRQLAHQTPSSNTTSKPSCSSSRHDGALPVAIVLDRPSAEAISREGHLRGLERVGPDVRLVEGGEDLEVRVWPPAWVATRDRSWWNRMSPVSVGHLQCPASSSGLRSRRRSTDHLPCNARCTRPNPGSGAPVSASTIHHVDHERNAFCRSAERSESSR